VSALCARVREGGCTRPGKRGRGHFGDLYVTLVRDDDGAVVDRIALCYDHAPRDATACSHSMTPTGSGRCPWCGRPDPTNAIG